MSFIHDIIKRQYVYQGYLPNYPYHLISDNEMFGAFIYNDVNWFDTNYPRDLVSSDSELLNIYDALVDNIKSHIDRFKEDNTSIPDWVYSYMIGSTISPLSDKRDIHDLLVMLGEDNLEDDFTLQASRKCYIISKKWIEKLPYDEDTSSRTPTVFGEPCVIKSLRLNPIYN